MFRLIFVGIAAGLATAVPAPNMVSPAECPCLASWQAATATTSGMYGVGWGTQATDTTPWGAQATDSAAWGAQATGSASWGAQVTDTASWAAATGTTPPCTTSATSTAGGAMTHTVIVAPTQGILRYVPFVVNASVGDTIDFVWNANNHTVTKSSQLAICNKTMDAPFASGEQNKSFIFQQTVNDTNSVYFYCGTPGHCPKGMFGIINPPNAAMGSNTTLANMMPAMAANSSGMAAMIQYTQMMTQNNTVAASWGGNIDMSGVPQWAQQYIAENVMYTRTFLAANPETLSADGSVSLANASSAPLKVPVDITSVQNGSASSQAGSSGSSSAPPGTGSSGTSSNPYPTMTSGTRQLGSSGIVSIFVVVATLAFIL
ncbi:hypothetical protein V8B97DRAFT_1697179 [Scleroderma yunnanense]